MTSKRKSRKATATVAALRFPKPPLPLAALVLRVGLILAAAAFVQHFLPQP